MRDRHKLEDEGVQVDTTAHVSGLTVLADVVVSQC